MYGQYSYEATAGARHTKDEMTPYTAVKSRKAGHNRVVIWYPDGSKAYRLHMTDVVRVWPDGTVRLDDGGWQTMTTRRAMMQGLDALLGVNTGVYGERTKSTDHVLVTTGGGRTEHHFSCPCHFDAKKTFGVAKLPNMEA